MSTTQPDVVLSAEQNCVLQLVLAGRSVFFTGPAGTGKSVLLREIIKALKYRESTVAITASTGLAGLNIRGTTLHSFAGIGLGKAPAEKLLKNIKKSLKLTMRWRHKQTLIIDEISMIDATLFDKVEYIARKIRNKKGFESEEKPFGGLQLIISGDFFQLPPVPDRSYNRGEKLARFAFDAKSWAKCLARPIFLTVVFRQRDNAFIRILSNMRRGILTSQDVQQLKGLSRPLYFADDIEPCQLFPTRQEVEACNSSKLMALPDPQHVYYAMDSAGYDTDGMPIPKEAARVLLERVSPPSIVALKVGAQVMLVQNLKEPLEHLVNGSMGKVVAFMSTQEAAKAGILKAPEPTGHGSDEEEKPSASPEEIVCFKLPKEDKQKPDKVIFIPGNFTVYGFSSNVEARRTQVPLMLAWALSIHKSQGQSLQRVKVDLGRIFEKGQAYVALSRATSMDGLEIANFDPEKVMAHPEVIKWYRSWNDDITTEDFEGFEDL